MAPITIAAIVTIASILSTASAAPLLRARDDNDDNDPNLTRNRIITGSVFFGGFFLIFVIGCTTSHFRKGGTWPDYFKAWGKGILILLVCVVLFPVFFYFLFLGCFGKGKKPQSQPQPRPLPANRRAGYAPEPPPMPRPQMPLDAVVILPDDPDLDDPDVVHGSMPGAIQKPGAAVLRPDPPPAYTP